MRRATTALSAFFAISLMLPDVALAQGSLANGVNQGGLLQVGGLDTWTFTAAKNDGITVSLGKVIGSGSDAFYPWLRLKGPDGSLLQESYASYISQTAVQVDRRAPSSGTYTVLVANSGNTQVSPSGYVVTLAKTSGPYSISAGDEGGPMTNGSHSGTLSVGDLDAWTVQAAANDSIVVSLGKVAGSASDSFYPWLRLKGPDGSLLQESYASYSSQTSVQVDQRIPLSGTYTVLVANGGNTQVDPATYVLTLSGPASGFTPAAILAVVGSTPGNGAYFRTRVQMYNPRPTPISGKLVYHTSSTSGGPNDPSFTYTLSAGQTVDYADLLPAMGIASGLGSIDILTTPGDPVPVISARIFSDGGANGTAGFFLDPIAPDAALQAGDTGVLLAPADPVAARLNLGIRSLEAGASLQVTVRNKAGAVRNIVNKTYGPTFFEQVSANAFVGVTLDGSDTITFAVTAGRAIVYGAQTDNKTQDPSVQYAKKVF